MHRLPTLCLAACCLLYGSVNHAAVTGFRDWTLSCDNILHCEASGFQPEEQTAPGHAAGLWLARDGGPGSGLTGRLYLDVPEGASLPGQGLTLKAGTWLRSGVAADQFFTAEQMAQMLPHLLDAQVIELSAGRLHWQISLRGLKAALLKMDAMQSRLDTPGALVRKGSKAENSVPRPPLAPLVKASPLPASRPDDPKLIMPILRATARTDCSVPLNDPALLAATIHRLSASRVLLLAACDAGAYQSTFQAWLANDRPPYRPEPVRLPDVDGSAGQLTDPAWQTGLLRSYAKGRGIGDCGSLRVWAWTGQQFALQHASDADPCSGIGGGIPLRIWTSRQQ
ncbi:MULTISPECIES: DUF1176 domain-containing protein [unclassified Paludibacterium]|uniref:DUF1176 domain-containing protein n=1 Tax=unclassified Paludibacterium TaxID=2618429 RepID=UPI001C0515A2|nr:DUF1176 domain-containing protein [Paludibacterium sp. B53371]BEV71667.1 DUF1176 domain-containing protein [Paludibacterium sp. THUN1379]